MIQQPWTVSLFLPLYRASLPSHPSNSTFLPTLLHLSIYLSTFSHPFLSVYLYPSLSLSHLIYLTPFPSTSFPLSVCLSVHYLPHFLCRSTSIPRPFLSNSTSLHFPPTPSMYLSLHHILLLFSTLSWVFYLYLFWLPPVSSIH